jgi:ubiquinone/menaquinone biosynthesis C-methylase UbiE
MSEHVRLDTHTGYDQWAAIYDEELNPLVILEDPLVRSWVADPAGLRVADVGCGTGRHAVWLARAGASIDAYDFSSAMMAKALEKAAGLEIRFHEHTLPDPLPVADGTFDLVLFALVADHIKDLDAAFADLHRVTRPGGQIIFTVLHPAMNLLGITARFIDPASGGEVRVEAFEHTYADYVTAVLRARLEVAEICEFKADEKLAAQAPRAKSFLGWPLLLAMNLRRRP